MAVTQHTARTLARGVLGGLLLAAAALVAQGAERPLALVQPAPAAAEETRGERQASAKSSATKPSAAAELDSEQEAAALAFVNEHHGELAGLLRVLKSRNEQQYRNAIRDLSRTVERLEQYRRRGDERYRLELRAWGVKSRIQLLTARLQMSDSPELREELAEAFRRQARLRAAQLRFERERVAARLDKLDEQLERLGNDPDAVAERNLELVLRRLDESKRDDSRATPTARPKPRQRPAQPPAAPNEK